MEDTYNINEIKAWLWEEKSDFSLSSINQWDYSPKISIVTPSYNQAQYLEETIRSVLLQGYPNLEYIIIDGGSTDGSVEIIKKYAPWLTYWVSEPDRGQSHAINKGFEVCTGEIINWLNSDDFLLPGALNLVAKNSLKRTSEFFIIAGNALILTSEGRFIPRLHIREAQGWIRELGVRWEGGIQASWFFSKALYLALGGVNESLHYCMDIDLSFRWVKQSPEYLIEEQPLAVFREHEEAKTTKNKRQSLIERHKLYISAMNDENFSKETRRQMTKDIRKEISSGFLSGNKPLELINILSAISFFPNQVLRISFWKSLISRLGN